MSLWRRKPKGDPPPPEALNVRHSFVNAKPGSNTVLTLYPTAQPAGKATYATHIGQNPGDLWPLGAQEAGWAHYDRVPDNGDPRIYYAQREASKQQRNALKERRIGIPLQELPHSGSRRGDDAKWSIPGNNRPTQNLIPVNGHEMTNTFFGHHVAWELTGTHSSMALVHRNYPIGGMAPQQRLRNTLRVTPPSYDATSADIDSATSFTTQAGIYVSPGAASPGIAYGLRGGH